MKKEFKIGLFAVMVMVVSFFVLNYLRGEDVFNRENEYVSAYDNVEGLVASAPVYIKGYKAGKVSDVTYDMTKSCFYVTCSVSKQFVIPSDSRMTIYGVDIMGGKGVRIDAGVSEVPAADGDTLVAAFEPGLMDGIASQVGPLLGSVGSTVDSLRVAVSNINTLLSAENSQKISEILKHLEETISNARELSSAVNGKSEQLSMMIDNLEAFSGKLGSMAEKVDSTMVGVGEVIDTLNSADIYGLVDSAKKLLDNMNSPDGTVGKLFVDNSVYNSVDSLLNNIDELVKKIQESPRKYLKISVF